MNTYIISSKSPKQAQKEIDSINNINKVDRFDFEYLTFEKQLGIEDVRQIQKKIFLKPLKGDKKSIVLALEKGASLDAQNSMLKLLEEPPESSIIILVTENFNNFIPTILSRVKIIELKDEREIDEDGLNKIKDLNGAGDSLYLAQELAKDKDKAIAWLENAILAARQEMLENVDNKDEAQKLRKIIHNIEITHYDLKNTNVNTRLTLENLFLNISI